MKLKIDGDQPFRAEVETAISAARTAGDMIAGRWDQGFEIRHKGTVDLVTEVDLAAEKIVVDALSQAYPNDGILAEEGGETHLDRARRWIVDPLDGTTNFSNGFPHFAVSIGLWDERGAIVGVIHDPLRNWTYWATRGGGAWRNEKRLRVSGADSLPNALLATGFPYDRQTNPDNNTHRFADLLRHCRGVRRAGAAALDLAYVACGWLDGYWEARLAPWDMAAGVLLVQEAGGRVTGLHGDPMEMNEGHLAATNGRIHAKLVERIIDADRRFAGES